MSEKITLDEINETIHGVDSSLTDIFNNMHVLNNKKPKRFFKTSDGDMLNIDSVIMFLHHLNNPVVKIDEKFNVKVNGGSTEFFIEAVDINRFMAWLETHGVDKPESEASDEQ